MYRNLKLQFIFVTLLTLTIASVGITMESLTAAQDEDKAGLELNALGRGGAAPLKAQDADRSGSSTDKPTDELEASSTTLNSAAGEHPAGSVPPPSSPSRSRGSSEEAVASDDSKLIPSLLPPSGGAVGDLKSSGGSDLGGGASPVVVRGATGTDLQASTLSASVSLSASIIAPGNEPSSVIFVVEQEKITEFPPKKTELGVGVRHLRGDLSYLTSHLYQAMTGKESLARLRAHRLLNLYSPYCVVDLTLLAALESVVNHKINQNAIGRGFLNIEPPEKIQIRHLFDGIVGSSEDAIPAALLYVVGKGAALQELRYIARRGYMAFETPGTDKNSRYSPEGRRKFLSGVMGPENFGDGVVEGRTLYLTAYNTKTGQTDIFSNSPDYRQFKQVAINSVLEAATASPDMFPSQHLPLGREDGPFQDGIQGVDAVYSVYQKIKSGVSDSFYEIVSIGSETQDFGPISDMSGFLKRMRQIAGQSLAAKFSAEIEDQRAPIKSFASFQFKEGQLGKADDFSPSHVRAWVNTGLQAMHSKVFEHMVKQLGFNMPDATEVNRIQKDISRTVLYDLDSPIYSELPKAEQTWLKRVLVGETQTLGFMTYTNLSYQKKLLSTEQKLALLSAVTADLSREPDHEKWYKLWSTKELPISDGVHKGYEYARIVEAMQPLTLGSVSRASDSSIDVMLKSFMTIFTNKPDLFGSKIDDYTSFWARIYWVHMLKDVKDQADPAQLRQFQAKCIAKAHTNMGRVRGLVGNSREYKLSEDLGKYIDELYGPAKSIK